MNSDRSPLLAPFLQSVGDPPPAESVANFYSPYDSISHSDEEDEQVSVLEITIFCNVRSLYSDVMFGFKILI